MEEILKLHKAWLLDASAGVRADLRYASLSGADLSGADLSGADLREADLGGADLREASLRYTDLCYTNLRGADLRYTNLSGADLSGADLREADLGGASLRGADLRYTDLRGAIGNLKQVKSLQTDTYRIVYTHNMLYIGCQKHTIEKWISFDDQTIAKMDINALVWWRVWKPIILNIIQISPAEHTK